MGTQSAWRSNIQTQPSAGVSCFWTRFLDRIEGKMEADQIAEDQIPRGTHRLRERVAAKQALDRLLDSAPFGRRAQNDKSERDCRMAGGAEDAASGEHKLAWT
jgi:hypothetical protein